MASIISAPSVVPNRRNNSLDAASATPTPPGVIGRQLANTIEGPTSRLVA
jgi:hypothetical protein